MRRARGGQLLARILPIAEQGAPGVHVDLRRNRGPCGSACPGPPRRAPMQAPGRPCTAAPRRSPCRGASDSPSPVGWVAMAGTGQHVIPLTRADLLRLVTKFGEGATLVHSKRDKEAVRAEVRAALAGVAGMAGVPMLAPPLRYCTDNAAMVGYVGAQRLLRGESHSHELAPSASSFPSDFL